MIIMIILLKNIWLFTCHLFSKDVDLYSFVPAAVAGATAEPLLSKSPDGDREARGGTAEVPGGTQQTTEVEARCKARCLDAAS